MRSVFFAFVTFVAACGSSSNNASNDMKQASATVTCPGTDNGVNGGNVCDAVSEYCIKTETSGGVGLSNTCAPKPPGCNDCTCAQRDAPSAWMAGHSNTNNCASGETTCSATAGSSATSNMVTSITVTCVAPPLGA